MPEQELTGEGSLAGSKGPYGSSNSYSICEERVQATAEIVIKNRDRDPAGLTPFYVPVLMRVGWFCDRTWGGRSVAESGSSSAANSAGVLYPIPLCNLS